MIGIQTALLLHIKRNKKPSETFSFQTAFLSITLISVASHRFSLFA